MAHTYCALSHTHTHIFRAPYVHVLGLENWNTNPSQKLLIEKPLL